MKSPEIYRLGGVTLEQLLDDPGRLESWGQAARERALDQWDSRRILKRFRFAMQELVGKPA